MIEVARPQVDDGLAFERRGNRGAYLAGVGEVARERLADTRESPALDIMSLLEERGAKLSYTDPWVPRIEFCSRELLSTPIETAAPALQALVTSKGIREADLTEKIAIFESYGLLGGAGATDVLRELLNKKGFLGRREPSQIRASAARALGKGGLPGAHEALLAAQRDTDAVVRTAVRQALEEVGEEAE